MQKPPQNFWQILHDIFINSLLWLHLSSHSIHDKTNNFWSTSKSTSSIVIGCIFFCGNKYFAIKEVFVNTRSDFIYKTALTSNLVYNIGQYFDKFSIVNCTPNIVAKIKPFQVDIADYIGVGVKNK